MSADLLYSQTERDLAAALTDLLADQADPAGVIARTERPDTYDTKLWRTVAAEIGIAGLLIPEALGGAGAGASRCRPYLAAHEFQQLGLAGAILSQQRPASAGAQIPRDAAQYPAIAAPHPGAAQRDREPRLHAV